MHQGVYAVSSTQGHGLLLDVLSTPGHGLLLLEVFIYTDLKYAAAGACGGGGGGGGRLHQLFWKQYSSAQHPWTGS